MCYLIEKLCTTVIHIYLYIGSKESRREIIIDLSLNKNRKHVIESIILSFNKMYTRKFNIGDYVKCMFMCGAYPWIKLNLK